VHNVFSKYIKEEKYYLSVLNNYNNNYNKWLYNYKLISIKLCDLANNIENRKKIINFIKNNFIKNNNNNISINKVLNIFYSSYIFENKTGNEILEIKDDITNPYYWITRWKDYECNRLLQLRPNKPNLNYYDKLKNIPSKLINCLELVPFWFKINKNMTLYVIHISIIKHNTNNKYFYNNYLPIRSITPNGIPYVKIKHL
jgi:hypothetical protein